MRTYVFWMLNVLLLRFNLQVNELGFFYNNSTSNKSYLVTTDINEALRFLKIEGTIQDLLSMNTLAFYRLITKSAYFNKATFALVDLNDLTKEQRNDLRISRILPYIKSHYDELNSNYRYSRTPLLYDHIIFYTYGKSLNVKLTPKKLRESEIKNKITSKIIKEKYEMSDIKVAQEILESFKDYIESLENNFYEQYIINNKAEIILKRFDKFFKEKMVCAYPN